MDSGTPASNVLSPEITWLPDTSEITKNETSLIEKSADICFPQDSNNEVLYDQKQSNSNEELFTIDTEGNEYMSMPEKHLPQPSSPSCNRLIKGDPKIAAKYQWRQGKQFCDDGNDDADDSSSESEDEDFNKILQSKYVETDETEVKKQQPKKAANNLLLDKEYYELPNFEALSLTCLESCVIEPFGKVFQHYDALAMIKAHPNKPYLDMDTMLFNAEKAPIGRIYELFGLVCDTLYNILFSSVEEAAKLSVGTEIFYAPCADESITKILCLEDLKINKKWHKDEGLGESDGDEEEEDEESQYFNNLKKQLEEYEQRKRRGRNESVSSNTTRSSLGPTQPKQRRGNNFIPRPQNYNGNRYPNATPRWHGHQQQTRPYYPSSNQQFNANPFALPPQPSYYVPPNLFHYPPPRNITAPQLPYPPHADQ